MGFSNKADYISDKYNQFDKPLDNDFTTNISFSQFEMFMKCPKRWELKYVQKIGKFSPTVHLVFGNAIHKCIQQYLVKLFSGKIKDANSINFAELLATEMKTAYDDMLNTYRKKEPNRDSYNFTSKSELKEFYFDGLDIIKYVTRDKTRKQYFDKKQYDMVAIELPIKSKIHEDYEVYILMFIDILLYDKVNNSYEITDLKSSTKSWSSWQKKDKLKLSQALIYKKFLSKEFDIDMTNIESKFLVLKRKVNAEMYEGHTQKVVPAQGKPSMNKIQKLLELMVKYIFDNDGKIKSNVKFPAISGDGGKNCKFCEYKDTPHCPANSRLSIVNNFEDLINM